MADEPVREQKVRAVGVDLIAYAAQTDLHPHEVVAALGLALATYAGNILQDPDAPVRLLVPVSREHLLYAVGVLGSAHRQLGAELLAFANADDIRAQLLADAQEGGKQDG